MIHVVVRVKSACELIEAALYLRPGRVRLHIEKLIIIFCTGRTQDSVDVGKKANWFLYSQGRKYRPIVWNFIDIPDVKRDIQFYADEVEPIQSAGFSHPRYMSAALGRSWVFIIIFCIFNNLEYNRGALGRAAPGEILKPMAVYGGGSRLFSNCLSAAVRPSD